MITILILLALFFMPVNADEQKEISISISEDPEKIREMFGIECDFDPDEKKKIEEENKWAE